MKPAAWVLAAIGAALLLIGIILGTSGITRLSTNCGSGFGGVSNDAIAADYGAALNADANGETIPYDDLSKVSTECKSAVSDRKTIALALTIPGGLLLFSGLVMMIPAYTKRDEIPTVTSSPE